MKLSEDEALRRLLTHEHGVLCTLHATRGVDVVPVVFAVDEDGYVAVPIDSIKPKASLQLQRERNLENDPRATLLIEQWDRDDWSKLWWVRAHLRYEPEGSDRDAELAAQLENRFPQYQGQPFVRLLVLRVVTVAGWAAAG